MSLQISLQFLFDQMVSLKSTFVCRLNDAWHEICSPFGRLSQREMGMVIAPDKLWDPAVARVVEQECHIEEEKSANSIVVAEDPETDCCQQSYEPSPELPDDAEPIDDTFIDRLRRLASFV